MKTIYLITLTLIFNSMLNAKTSVDASTVDSLNLEQYMGLWYEIARFDTWFEKDVNYVTASYTLLPNGAIKVINQSYKNGKVRKSKGRAKKSSSATPGKLRVSFFLMFYSDYNILELDHKGYKYAMIGSEDGKYFWILSRSPRIEPENLNMLLRRARKRGYDMRRLVFCAQQDPRPDDY